MESPPCLHHKISIHESEWSSFIKIFEGDKFIFISGESMSNVLIFISDLSSLSSPLLKADQHSSCLAA